MKKSKGTERDLVSIVMATYNPRLDWFVDQLVSLDSQTYENLELIICDDCSSEVSIEDISRCVKDNITRFPFIIMRNDKNLGSTKTFELLTNLTKGKYIAYCDQDDVWHREKVEKLVKYFNDEKVVLAYSDVSIIDAEGYPIAKSISDIRKRHVFHGGDNLSEKLFVRNFIIGCSMLIKRDVAME